TCTIADAPLTAPCPVPVELRTQGGGQSVTRTISATDGGAATLVVNGIDVDLTRPSVSIAGVRSGTTYVGAAPRGRCVAADRLSGVASCRLMSTVRGTQVTYRAIATDRAGNVSSTSRTVTVLSRYYLAGSSFVN